jgi:hypothetical protein
MDHSTIGAVLRVERDLPDGWVRRREQARGDRADLYEIVIPDRYASLWDGRPLPTGRLDGVHPLFAPGLIESGVGLAAWSVERAVAGGASSVREVIEATGLSESQVKRCLKALARVRLVARRTSRSSEPATVGGLYRTRRTLDRAGQDVGLRDRVLERRQWYDVERGMWRVWLAERGRQSWTSAGFRPVPSDKVSPDDGGPLWPPGWDEHMPANDPDPPSRTDAAVELLRDAFGAELLDLAIA